MTTPNDDAIGGRPAHSLEGSSRDERVIPVVQEELDVHKRRVETAGGARVSKSVAEREVVVDEPLVQERVDVERVTVNRPLTEPAAVRQEGDTTIVPVMEEVLVVEKRLVLKEEIRITRRRSEVREPRRVALRTEHVAVERLEGSARDVSVPGGAATTDSILEQKKQAHEELRRHLSSTPEEK